MPSLSVVVFKHGAALPHATVQLDGPGGSKTAQTNLAGAVSFDDLAVGMYTVNAAHGPDFLGNGFMTLGPGKAGVIHLKYPKAAAQSAATGEVSIAVNIVYSGGVPATQVPVTIALNGPTPQSGATSGPPIRFSNLAPGEYTAFAWTDPASGVNMKGNVDVTVTRGGKSSAAINLTIPLASPRETELYDSHSVAEIEAQLKAIESEIKTTQFQIDGNQELGKHYKKEMEGRNEETRGMRLEEISGGAARQERQQKLKDKRHDQIQIRDALKQALERKRGQ